MIRVPVRRRFPVVANSVLLGDSLEWLQRFPSDVFHCVVTDPPYGLSKQPDMRDVLRHWLNGDDYEHRGSGFMGKDWDSFVPGPKVWEQVMRVLKPGGHIFSFSGCYDRETEVLTLDGWKYFTDVTMEDEFASLNPKTDEIVYQKPVEVVRQTGHKKMHRWSTNKVDLLVTPNHKCLVKNMGGSKYSKWRLQRADELPAAIRMKKNGTWQGNERSEFVLPSVMQNIGHGHYRELPEIRIPMDSWLKFFGLWIAEGSASKIKMKTGWGYNVQICHFDNDNLDEIEQELSPFFSVCRYRKSGKLRINEQRLTEYLMQFGKAWEKFLPSDIKSLCSRQLKILCDWYMRGDGSANCKDGVKRNAYTTSFRLVGDLQEIALKMGISADYYKTKMRLGNIGGRTIVPVHQSYCIRFNKVQNEPELYSCKTRNKSSRIVLNKTVDFDDDVFCVELPKFHTLYVRRNGKAVWCGNTRTYDLMVTAMRIAGAEVRDKIDVHCDLESYQSWVQGQGFPKSLNIGKTVGELSGSDEAKRWEGYGTALKPAHEPIAVFGKDGAEPVESEDGARFSYVAKASRAQRNLGCDDLYWLEETRITRDEYESLVEENVRRKGEKGYKSHKVRQGNIHVTVKPLELCRYLVRMVKPPGRCLLLDPFCGSGSILCACILEGCDYVGIDIEESAVTIARARTKYWRENGD